MGAGHTAIALGVSRARNQENSAVDRQDIEMRETSQAQITAVLRNF
jgi:hypothetical protein